MSKKQHLNLKIVKQSDNTIVTKLIAKHSETKCTIGIPNAQIVKVRKNDTHTSLFLKISKQSIHDVKLLEQLCLGGLDDLKIKVDEHISSLIIDVHHSTILRLKLTKLDDNQKKIIEGSVHDFVLRAIGVRCQKGVSQMIWSLQNALDQTAVFGQVQINPDKNLEECDDDCIGPCQEDWQEMINNTINIVNDKVSVINKEIDKKTEQRDQLLSMKQRLSYNTTVKDLELINEQVETFL